jgi:ABC-type uncharacterized transport system fused permease/ATPase subunit
MFALLDEATSTLDPVLEAQCMRCVKSAGVTVISVAHRASVQKFHEQLLRMDGKGGYEVVDLDEQ